MTDEFRDLGSLTPKREERPTPPSIETHGDEIGGWAIIGLVMLVLGSAVVALCAGEDSAAAAALALVGSLVGVVGFFATIVAAVAKGVQIGNRS
jgi:hypothetical protein